MVAFTSARRPGEHHIDDGNWQQHAAPSGIPSGQGRGRVPRDYGANPLGTLTGGVDLDLPLIPRENWDQLIEEAEAKKQRLSDLILQSGIPSKDQDGTSQCWFNAVTGCFEVSRMKAGLPYIDFSAASGATVIKNGRDNGGWGGEASQWMVEHGIVPVSKWEANRVNMRLYTPEVKALALDYRIIGHYDIDTNGRLTFDRQAACLFSRFPVYVGLDWWGHEVYLTEVIIAGQRKPDEIRMAQKQLKEAAKVVPMKNLDALMESAASKYGARFRNSWADSYGDRGFSTLSESKATGDDAGAILNTTLAS